MIIVDELLRRRARDGNPVRVAMIGAGFMGVGIAKQVIERTPGMELVAVSNRNVDAARRAYAAAGVDATVLVRGGETIEAAISRHVPVVTDDALGLASASGYDAIIECTGAIDFAANVVATAIEHGKHVVLMNAELDGTIGPILKQRADEAGVVYTACDGDQPGVQMNLYRFVRGIGMEPLLCGNIKGLQDPYRNPTTQEGFARRWGQKPRMVTSFADGTKISFEQAIVANGTGMTIHRRGMLGRDHPGHVDELVDFYDAGELRALGGAVDYVVGSKPGPGVFVLAGQSDAAHRHYLELYKLGTGPLYSFYTPYHLCHFEVPSSIARAVLLQDAVLAPLGGPVVEVVTTAKTDLHAGTVLDGFGGYHTYGQCETARITDRDNLLPAGIAPDCRLKRAVRKDEVLTYDDVELPEDRLSDRLRGAQRAHWFARVPA